MKLPITRTSAAMQEPGDARQRPRVRMQHARLRRPQEDDVDDERRQKQGEFGEDGADHRSRVPGEGSDGVSPSGTRLGIDRKNITKHSMSYEGLAARHVYAGCVALRAGLARPGDEGLLPVNPLVQIPQDSRGHAPDIALAERHGVVLLRITPFQSRLWSAWFCTSIRKASGTSKASATSAADSTSA